MFKDISPSDRSIKTFKTYKQFTFTNSDSGSGIEIVSIHSYITRILLSYSLLEPGNFTFDEYEEAVNELHQLLLQHALTGEELRLEAREILYNYMLDRGIFDYAFIDEGQDLPLEFYNAIKNISNSNC